MKKRYVVVLTMALWLSSSASFAAAPEQIGMVKSMVGDVVIVRNGRPLKAAPNVMLFQGDDLQTGTNGKIGLILEDDTAISMGHDSRLVLTAFNFRPKENNLSFLIKLLHGTLSFISGQIAKLAPGSVRIQTPHATIGVRGSHVLVKVD